MRRIIFAIFIACCFSGSLAAQDSKTQCQALQDLKDVSHYDVLNRLELCYQELRDNLQIETAGSEKERRAVLSQNIARDVTTLRQELCQSTVIGVCELGQALEKRQDLLLDTTVKPNIKHYDFDINLGVALAIGNANNRPERPLPLYICSQFLSGDGVIGSATCSDLPAALKQRRCDTACEARRDAVVKAIPVLLNMEVLASDQALALVFVNHAQKSAAAWENYVIGGDKTQGMTQWELRVNDWLTSSTVSSESSFKLPPKHQYVALRPSIGFKAYDSGGKDVEIAGLVELFGVRWWDEWGKGGKRVNLKGLSFVTAYSPSDTANDFGFGVMLDNVYKDFDVSVIARDSQDGTDIAVLLSVDVSKLLPQAVLEKGCKLLGAINC